MRYEDKNNHDDKSWKVALVTVILLLVAWLSLIIWFLVAVC